MKVREAAISPSGFIVTEYKPGFCIDFKDPAATGPRKRGPMTGSGVIRRFNIRRFIAARVRECFRSIGAAKRSVSSANADLGAAPAQTVLRGFCGLVE
jgi:hypothetical protein